MLAKRVGAYLSAQLASATINLGDVRSRNTAGGGGCTKTECDMRMRGRARLEARRARGSTEAKRAHPTRDRIQH